MLTSYYDLHITFDTECAQSRKHNNTTDILQMLCFSSLKTHKHNDGCVFEWMCMFYKRNDIYTLSNTLTHPRVHAASNR